MGSNWQNRVSEAATTMSPASAISMPIVNVMPCTAVTRGLRSRRSRPNGSTGSDVCAAFRRAASRLASSLKNSGISNPAVVWSPANTSTPTNSSGSSSSRVNASLSSAVIFGVNAFFFSTRSTVITKMCSSTTSVRTSPWGCLAGSASDVDSIMEPNGTPGWLHLQPCSLFISAVTWFNVRVFHSVNPGALDVPGAILVAPVSHETRHHSATSTRRVALLPSCVAQRRRLLRGQEDAQERSLHSSCDGDGDNEGGEMPWNAGCQS